MSSTFSRYALVNYFLIQWSGSGYLNTQKLHNTITFEFKNHFQNEKFYFLKLQVELVWILCVPYVDYNVLIIIETSPDHHDSSCYNKLHIWLDPDHATTKLSRKWLILVRRHNIEAFFWKTIFIRSISNSLDME